MYQQGRRIYKEGVSTRKDLLPNNKKPLPIGRGCKQYLLLLN
jgi:hypothetical protein